MKTTLIAVLAALTFAALPVWPHARKWGYAPTIVLGLALLALIALALLGKF